MTKTYKVFLGSFVFITMLLNMTILSFLIIALDLEIKLQDPYIIETATDIMGTFYITITIMSLTVTAGFVIVYNLLPKLFIKKTVKEETKAE